MLKKKHVGMTVLLLVFSLGSGRGPKSDERFSSGQLWRPQEGTSYVDDLPREIIWLKDGAEMVLVPGGEFLFGRIKEKLSLPPFYIDKFPVTNEHYKKLVTAIGHPVPFVKENWAKALNWRGKDYPKGKGEHPVVLVTIQDAADYCKWAGKAIPMEERWEKAARGTNGRTYPWGNEFDESKCNTHFSGIGHTTPVDKYPTGVSPYGCYDMAGSVWEWTIGRLGAFVRGGSFFDGDAEIRCELRVRHPSPMQSRSNNIGFCCCWFPPR
jgi:formylglycine-generating enzyme required for sulfatase activity